MRSNNSTQVRNLFFRTKNYDCKKLALTIADGIKISISLILKTTMRHFSSEEMDTPEVKSYFRQSYKMFCSKTEIPHENQFHGAT